MIVYYTNKVYTKRRRLNETSPEETDPINDSQIPLLQYISHTGVKTKFGGGGIFSKESIVLFMKSLKKEQHLQWKK